jgi:hypothetical protein
MSNDVFFCTAKVLAESGATYSFGNSTQSKEYCISIHTEYEKIHVFIAQDEYEVIDAINGKFSDMFEQCVFFQKFKNYVLNEMTFIIKIKTQNEKFSELKLLGPVNPDAKGSQFLWKKGNSYIVTSWTIPPWGGPSEILGFESDPNGNIQTWLDLGKLCSIPDLIDNHKIVAEVSFKRM